MEVVSIENLEFIIHEVTPYLNELSFHSYGCRVI